MPEVKIDPKFREWLIATYGEGGANRIMAQYARDISLGRLPAQNQYYSVWVQRGRPGAEDIPSPQPETVPDWLATQGTPPIGFGGATFDWTAGLPEVPLVEEEQPQVVPDTEEPEISTTFEQIGGQNVVVTRDNEGNVISVQPFGAVREQPQQEMVTPEFQLRAMARQFTEQRAGLEEGVDKQVREGIIAGLQAELVGLTGPADWIKRWDVGQRIKELQEPGREGISMAERIRGKEAEVESTQRAARRADVAFPSLAETDTRIFTPESLQAQADIARADVTLRTLGKLQTGEIGALEGREAFRGQAAPAPAWLPEFVPGLTAGQPIERLPIRTPSGQLISRTPQSVSLGMAGFAEWAGGRPWADILEHGTMMQPKAVGGAGRIRVAPARQ